MRVGDETNLLTLLFERPVLTVLRFSYGDGIAGGFGSYILGMDQQFHDRVNTRAPGDIPGNENVKNPELGWMIAFLTTVSFVGIFSIVVLRKVLLHNSTMM